MKYALTAVVLVTMILVGLIAVDWVSAHGSGFQLTRRGMAGPYELLLGTIPDPPVVGEAILILQVADPNTGVRVVNADVSLRSEGPGGVDVPMDVGADSFDPSLYESRAVLAIEGTWTFVFSVSGEDGSGSARFTYDVKRTSPIAGVITLATLLAFMTILGLSIRAFLKQRDSPISTT